MSKGNNVTEVGASRFRNVVNGKISAVKIVDNGESILMKFSTSGGRTYQTKSRVFTDPKRAWLNVFPGTPMPKGKKVKSTEEIKTDLMVNAGVFDELNDAINFIGAR